MKQLLFMLLASTFCCLPLQAEIVKTSHIEDVLKEIDENTLVFFNIAEVLMDTETSLGTQAWRKYIRTRLDAKQHDALTLFVFEHVPPKTPEPATAKVIACLQQKKIPVFALTSRGRHEWYSTQIPDVDLLTEKLLRQINIDFSLTPLPRPSSSSKAFLDDHFHGGIIYATNSLEKGDVLVQFLKAADLHPSKIVFVDDKADSLAAVDLEMKKRGIPFIGFLYSRTAEEHAQFDPMIANIQLVRLLSTDKILSDSEANQIKAKIDPRLDHETYFRQIMNNL